MKKQNGKAETAGVSIGNPLKKYQINEVFYSLQGEGSFVGTAMIFLRFAGCNLKCSFCDTNHSVKHEWSIEEILKYLMVFKQGEILPDVCFTGGEPTLQVDRPLMEAVTRAGFQMHLETNGTRTVPLPLMFRCITISPKGIPVHNQFREKWHFNNRDLKIIFDVEDRELPAMLDTWGALPFHQRYVQPCDYGKSPKTIANFKEAIEFVRANPDWNLSVQLHKMLGVR